MFRERGNIGRTWMSVRGNETLVYFKEGKRGDEIARSRALLTFHEVAYREVILCRCWIFNLF